MENNLNQESESAKTEQSKTAVKEGAKGLWISLKTYRHQKEWKPFS